MRVCRALCPKRGVKTHKHTLYARCAARSAPFHTHTHTHTIYAHVPHSAPCQSYIHPHTLDACVPRAVPHVTHIHTNTHTRFTRVCRELCLCPILGLRNRVEGLGLQTLPLHPKQVCCAACAMSHVQRERHTQRQRDRERQREYRGKDSECLWGLHCRLRDAHVGEGREHVVNAPLLAQGRKQVQANGL